MTDRQSVIPINDQVRALREAYERHPDLKTGGGGGNSGGMDERLTRLESQFDKLRDDNTRIREQLATLTERVAHLPGKGFIVSASLMIVAGLSAVIAFADKLQSLVQ